MNALRSMGWPAMPAAAGLIVILAMTPALAGDETAVPAAEGDEAVEAEAAADDPLEPLNRATYQLNRVLRHFVINPVAGFYKAFTPPPVQEAVSNVASNLTEPMTVVSSILQGDSENAENATKRFFINTTVGIAGIRDEATEMGIERRKEDLGQAAGAHGVGGGAHVVVPVIGPSNTRDLAGDVVNFLVNPLSAADAVDAATDYADNRESLEGLTKTSVDPYVTERDAYEQNRDFKIRNNALEVEEIPDFDE